MLSLSQLDSFSKEVLEERVNNNIEDIRQRMNKNPGKLESNFLKLFDDLFMECVAMQERKEKGKIAFIHIFYLKSPVITESYEMQINLFDKNSYMDQTDCYRLFVPEFFIQYYKEDMEYFYKKAKMNVFGFNYANYQEIRLKYYDLYLLLIGQFFLNLVKRIVELPSFLKMEKEEGLVIIYGGYMDRGLQIYPPVEVKA